MNCISYQADQAFCWSHLHLAVVVRLTLSGTAPKAYRSPKSGEKSGSHLDCAVKTGIEIVHEEDPKSKDVFPAAPHRPPPESRKSSGHPWPWRKCLSSRAPRSKSLTCQASPSGYAGLPVQSSTFETWPKLFSKQGESRILIGTPIKGLVLQPFKGNRHTTHPNDGSEAALSSSLLTAAWQLPWIQPRSYGPLVWAANSESLET